METACQSHRFLQKRDGIYTLLVRLQAQESKAAASVLMVEDVRDVT